MANDVHCFEKSFEAAPIAIFQSVAKLKASNLLENNKAYDLREVGTVSSGNRDDTTSD